jgi:hypothetical protein
MMLGHSKVSTTLDVYAHVIDTGGVDMSFLPTGKRTQQGPPQLRPERRLRVS